MPKPKRTKKLPVAHCRGCRDNFYNGNNPLGVTECWGRTTAKLVRRRRIHMDERPPHTAKPQLMPDCYSESRYVFQTLKPGQK